MAATVRQKNRCSIKGLGKYQHREWTYSLFAVPIVRNHFDLAVVDLTPRSKCVYIHVIRIYVKTLSDWWHKINLRVNTASGTNWLKNRVFASIGSGAKRIKYLIPRHTLPVKYPILRTNCQLQSKSSNLLYYYYYYVASLLNMYFQYGIQLTVVRHLLQHYHHCICGWNLKLLPIRAQRSLNRPYVLLFSIILIFFFESLGTGSDLEPSFFFNRTASRNCGTAQA